MYPDTWQTGTGNGSLESTSDQPSVGNTVERVVSAPAPASIRLITWNYSDPEGHRFVKQQFLCRVPRF